MDWCRSLLGGLGSSIVVLLTGILVIPLPSSITDEKLCDEVDRSFNLCPKVSGEARDDSIDVHATNPGSPGTTNSNTNANTGSSDASDSDNTILPGPAVWRLDPDQEIPPGLFPDGTEFEGAPAPMIREPWQMIEPTILSVDEIVTVDDLVNLRPAAAGLRMEPNGWTVIGLDTNFWIDVTTNTQSGELLGRSASVRFTPIGYRFNYGDSGTVNHASAGGSWTTQNLAEFDPTPTSHIYTQPGSYTVTAAVEYSAQYQFDGATWMPVLGTVRIPTNTLDVIAARATTVLVNNNCLTTPAGPGC
jgi:hypothetical protein